ncbi:proteasome subunit beta type-7-like [Tropilaelaps mercedesae]|uniref:Proteasome subunit beta n=1 Tax=Tropilaelaps mercedesae TaxID=418985 RepID=A0A1V9XH28_9ACAR|nr:proteasome subunit beta type-7-like [Tropilaelaps mercedesae]
MAATLAPELPPKGFSFSNCLRNEHLTENGYPQPNITKTGTTIVGVVYKDGVILGSDTRATGSNIVSDKNCEKLHYVAKRIYCAGAGTAADCDRMTRMMQSQLAIHALNTGREPRVCTLTRMLKQYLYRYQGMLGCALIVGGVDSIGPQVCSISPHGNTATLPYATMGSGSLAAVAVLESQWVPNMELDAAKKLVRDALAAGILNDMGSGSNVDLVVITQAGAQLLRPYEIIAKKTEHSVAYTYPKGATKVIEMKVVKFHTENSVTRDVSDTEPMEM